MDHPEQLPTPELVTFIVTHHHAFLRDALPYLVPLAAKVAHVHGDHDPRLRDLQAEFADLRETLDLHLEQEEATLFREVAAPAPDGAVLRRELECMRAEHREVAGTLARIRALCDGYTPPAWACTSYRSLLAELRLLEEDLLRHIHLEDEVLAPRLAERSAP
ncbi:MAG: hemerythrin domain-containing protein [Myxococcales bacterium]